MRSVLCSIVMAGVIGSLGCANRDVVDVGNSPSVVGDHPIQTDSAVYHVRTTNDAHEFTMGLTYTNRTGSRVYLATCRTPPPPVLEKLVDGVWVRAYSPTQLRCLSAPVVIEPGAVHSYEYRVLSFRGPNEGPKFEVAEINGTYRAVWNFLGTYNPDGPEPGLGTVLPLADRISNTFVLVGE